VESVRWEHELLAFLAGEVPEVCAPIRAPDGSTFIAREGQVVSVFPYVEGEHIERSDERIRAQLPEVLARMHKRALAWHVTEQRPERPSYSQIDWHSNLWWDWSLIDKTPVLERAFAESREWVISAPQLTTCAVHGDFHPGNILARHAKVVTIVDWSFARLDWAALDLAFLVGVLGVNEDGSIDAAVVERAIGTYADADGPGEPEVLLPLLRLFFLDVALFALTRRARGQSWNADLVAMMERGLEKLA
jgi:Ser/Thr protein kinase RdoA (MazF antagonist)